MPLTTKWILGIDQPQPGSKSSKRIQKIGQRLAKFAKLCEVPFEYTTIAKNWENITLEQLELREDEVLAVNCLFRLQHLLDDHVVAKNPRSFVLKMIRTMNPKVCTNHYMFAQNDFIRLYLKFNY